MQEIGPRLSSGVWCQYDGRMNSGDAAVPEVEMPLDPVMGVMLVLITPKKSVNGILRAKQEK